MPLQRSGPSLQKRLFVKALGEFYVEPDGAIFPFIVFTSNSERVLGPHESVEPFFTRSVGLGPPLSRRRGEPPALRRGEEGALSQAPPRGAGTGRRSLAVPLGSGPPGRRCAGAGHPSSPSCCAPPGTPARALPPPARPLRHDLFGDILLVAVSLKSIHSAVVCQDFSLSLRFHH